MEKLNGGYACFTDSVMAACFLFPSIFLWLFLCFLCDSIVFMYHIKLYFIFPFQAFPKCILTSLEENHWSSVASHLFYLEFIWVIYFTLSCLGVGAFCCFFLSLCFLKSFLYGTFQFILELKYVQDVFIVFPIRVLYQATRKIATCVFLDSRVERMLKKWLHFPQYVCAHAHAIVSSGSDLLLSWVNLNFSECILRTGLVLDWSVRIKSE